MMEAIIFVGLQGAGKSAFYRNRFSGTHLRINLDELKTRHRERLVLLTIITQRLSFVVDNTNATKEQRLRYIHPAKEVGYRLICYYFVPDVKRSLEQNAVRTGTAKVHPAAIYGTRKKMQSPTFDEGFDTVFHVQISVENDYVVTEQHPPTPPC
ncbi:MAG: AAA family ATPase [Verrucomicrobiales bacterium]